VNASKKRQMSWLLRVVVPAMLIVLLGLQTTSLAYSTEINAADSQGFLSANGIWIVDGQGNTVVLRGVNFSGYEYGLWDGAFAHSDADYVRMASWGFDVVRLPIAWNMIETQPGKYDETYFTNHVDRDIAWAKQHGMYVIIDMHQYGWSPHFTYYDSWHTAGVPLWAVSGYPNTSEGEAHAKADFWNNLGPNGTPPSSVNPSLQDSFRQMWMYVASRYAQEKTVAGYDIFNEPTIYTIGGDATIFYDPVKLCSETLPAFYNSVVDAIRTVDSNHMVFWGPAAIWNMDTLPPSRPNMVYSPHMNREWAYDGNKGKLQTSLERDLAISKKSNQPAFLGEFCTTVEAANSIQYILDMTDLMDANLLGGAWWTYGRFTFGASLLDPSGKERVGLVQNLIRPYIRGFSGSLSSSSYSPATLEFRADLRETIIVRVYLPAFYLPSFSSKVDNGSQSFTFFRGILTVQISGPASRLIVSSSSVFSVQPL
jgi:endoglycosylceramidase